MIAVGGSSAISGTYIRGGWGDVNRDETSEGEAGFVFFNRGDLGVGSQEVEDGLVGGDRKSGDDDKGSGGFGNFRWKI